METKIVISQCKNSTKHNIQECKIGLTVPHHSLVRGLISFSFVKILLSPEYLFEWTPILGSSSNISFSNGFCSMRLSIWTFTLLYA